MVVIPAYNEAPTVGRIVTRARAYAPVLVVDDGSTDDTPRIAHAAGADVVRHGVRSGKGQALRTGIAAARIRGATHMVTLDADGQHDPADVPRLLDAARRCPRAIVVGNRLGPDRPAMLVTRANAIRIAGFFVTFASGVAVTDTQSGFRVYPLALFEDVQPIAGGFVFETEVLVAAAGRGVEIVEIPIGTVPRAMRRSRFRPLVDGVAIAAYLSRQVLARWAMEASAAAAESTRFVRRDVRRARHAAVLAEASLYADAPAQWALSVGVSTYRRVQDCLVRWWTHPRLRRAGIAAVATAGTPVLAAAALAQALVPEGGPDVVTPLVRRLYAAERLPVAVLHASELCTSVSASDRALAPAPMAER
jgi:glycosyltransferase involved in cell wall biosynthesis